MGKMSNSTNKSVIKSIIELVQDSITIVKNQFELAKQNIAYSAKKFGKGLGFWITAFLLLNISLFFLLITLAFALTELGLSNWLSFLIVAIVMLFLAFLFIIFGYISFKKMKGISEITGTKEFKNLKE